MHGKRKLVLWVAVFALALPLFFTGAASAKYMSDGAVLDPAGGMLAPTDGICVIGLHADGTMDVDNTITNKRDCDAKLISVTAITSNDTLANVCGITGKNTAGIKYAAPGSSTCVTIDSSGYITGTKSMVNLDRNAQICIALGGYNLANNFAVKNTANKTAAKCIAYGWQYRGQDATGAPLSFGAKGTVAAAGTGFCYSNMRTGVTTSASCPSASPNASTSNGYSMKSGNCVYSYGINGAIDSALTVANGTSTAAGTVVDLSALTTMGDCLAAGASWTNWVPMGTGTITLGTSTYLGVTFDLVRQAVNSDEGCLHCHSYLSQQNGPAERFKDSFLKTGHKNMLRKVSAGVILVGPDANGALVPYTTDGTNTINFTNATISGPTITGGTQTLRYIYGDWMAALPSVAYDNGSTYGCGACHTGGYKDNSNPGVQSIGTPGYTPAQPADSGAAFVAAVTAGNMWDNEGISCERCHNATVPTVTSAHIVSGCTNSSAISDQTTCENNGGAWVASASSFPSTAPTGGGMGALAAGVGRNNLCFGCHQSMAKLYPAQGGAAGGTTQFDPTLIPTGVNHGASAGREFNGHVLGNSFLNSVHARYAGVNSTVASGGTVTNALGKLDLVDSQPSNTNTALEYGSTFRGYGCFQSTSSSSPGKTKADGSEIKTKADCEAIYGAGAWRADTGSSTAGISGVQGTCSTCHDVHNSLFVAGQEGIRKECADCHADDDFVAGMTAAYPSKPFAKIALINHPTGTNTPADTNKFTEACSVCHMAIQAKLNGDQVSMPAHLWRINTDPAYNTFPTAAQFNATDNTKDRNAQVAPEAYVTVTGATATYNNAVWVDLDLACGQCHVGSGVIGVSGAPVLTKAQLAESAKNMHNSDVSNTNCTTCHADKATADGTLHHVVGSTPCLTCHTARLHSGVLPANGKINPDYNLTTKLDTPGTGCLACHGPGGLAAASNIIPDGANDNHHSDHGNCNACHGAFGGQGANNAGKSLATDGGAFCLTCHNNDNSTGHGKHHAVQAVVDAGMDCMTCHAGDAGVPGNPPPVTNASCIFCHSRAFTSSPGGYTVRAVVQGTNHHNGTCTTCHTAEPYMNLMNTSGTTTYTSINTLTNSGTAAIGLCESCHMTSQTRSSDGSTLAAITPKIGASYNGVSNGPVDNHHQGHGGTNTDPVGYYCLGCHGSTTLDGTLQITASGLTPTVVSANKGFTNGADATSSLCLACHSSTIQSGQTYTTAASNHHAGACLTCHVPDQDGGAGITSMTTGTGLVIPWKPSNIPTWADCTACHGVTPKAGTISIVQVGPARNHHAGVCSECHVAAGVPAMPAPNYTITLDSKSNRVISNTIQTSCLTCHSAPKVRSSDGATLGAIVPSGAGDNHHSSHAYISKAAGTNGSQDPGLYCLGCHGAASDNGTTYSITASGLPTAVTSVLKSMVSNTEAGNADATSTLCVQCHSNVDTGHGSYKQYGPNQNHHAGKCVTCHRADGTWSGTFMAGSTVIPDGQTNDCMNCHAGTQTRNADGATLRAVNQGVNHHSGECTECHGTLGGVGMSAPSYTVTAGKIDDTIITSCLTCHQNDQLRSSDSTTLHAIHPKLNTYGGINDANGNQPDNHHRGHSNTPVTGGDPGMYCLGCHGSASVGGSTYAITGSGLPTATVSAQHSFTNGEDATSSLCMACHGSGIIQSGQTWTTTADNHHPGACLSCHKNDAVPGGAGATNQCINGTPDSLCSNTVGTGGNVSYKPADVPSWVDCTACHNGMIVASTKMAALACTTCHSAAGVKPAIADCRVCHAVAEYSDKVLTSRMASLHSKSNPTALFTSAADAKSNFKINYNASTSVCPTGFACTYEWEFGDGSTLNAGALKTTAHTFASAGTFTTTLTITTKSKTDTKGSVLGLSAKTLAVKPIQVVSANPIIIGTLPTVASGYTYTMPAISGLVSGGIGTVTVKINWGDGTPVRTVILGDGSGDIPHVYKNATGTLVAGVALAPYKVTVSAADTGVKVGTTYKYKSTATKSASLTVLPYYIAGNVKSKSGALLAGATLTLKQGTVIRMSAKSNVIGQYLFANVKPEVVTSPTGTAPYTLVVTKTGYTFGTAGVVSLGAYPVIAPDSAQQIILKDVSAN